MRDLLFSVEFWVAMALAALIKLRASPRITAFSAFVTVLVGVLAALVLTDPVLEFLGLAGGSYTHAVAALVALSCEHIARQILELRIVELIRAWRGGDK
jgi:hypothetical protein